MPARFQLKNLRSALTRERLSVAAMWLGVAAFLALLSSAFLQTLSWRSPAGLMVMLSGACYASACLILGGAISRALRGHRQRS
jgi:hypothetical protein